MSVNREIKDPTYSDLAPSLQAIFDGRLTNAKHEAAKLQVKDLEDRLGGVTTTIGISRPSSPLPEKNIHLNENTNIIEYYTAKGAWVGRGVCFE